MDQIRASFASKILALFLGVVFVSSVSVADLFLASGENSPALAQKLSNGNFSRTVGNGIRIYKNGGVEKFTPGQATILRYLTADEVASIQKAADAITGDLVDLNPSRPRCHNTFSVTYSVVQSSGVEKIVAREAGCHFYSEQNAEAIKTILDQFGN